ncbi:MAG: nitrilase-related carbon-nitrogen hydrolase [Trueperaceae bacterium]
MNAPHRAGREDRAAAIVRLVAAVALVAWACRPDGPWPASLVGAALVWPDLVRGSGPRAAATAALLLVPVPASAFEGLRVHDPGAWAAAAVVWSAAYGAVGALGGWVVGRVWARAVRPVGWAAAWAALDAAVVHGVPFLATVPVVPGYLLLDGPLVAWAAVGGPVALGVAWVVLGAALAGVVGGFGAAQGGAAARVAWGAAALALAGGAHAWTFAAGRTPTFPSLTVAVAHGVGDEAALAATRTDPDAATGIVAALVERAPASTAVDLHVWPESALGYVAPEALGGFADVARTLGAPVLAGGYRRDAEGGWRNSVVLATTAVATWVLDKRHLVPRYEAWLTAGVGERWPVRVAGRRWGVLVCWESLHLGAALERARSADVLLVLTHDGWAGATVTPWWHARSGRVLAWSTGRPVVFASHDGPSMAWSHDGRLLGLAAGTELGLTMALEPPSNWTTPYARFGPRGVGSVVVATWALLLGTVLARRASAAAARRQGCGASGPHAA